jgi:hypothetical protein
MREGEEMKDLDRLVADAIIDGIKNNNTSIDPTTNKPRGSLSSSLGAEDKTAVGPKSLPKIRTYTNDTATALNQSNADAARIKVSRYKRNTQQAPSGKKDFFIFIVLVLGIIGLIGVYMTYIKTSQNETVVIESEETIKKTLISFDEIIESKDNSPEKLLSQVKLENGITYILSETYSIENITDRYFEKIPNVLERNLSSEFMLGSLTTNNQHSPFLILKTSYKFALPGMQSWEENLLDDLNNLFVISSFARGTFLDVPNANSIIRTNELIIYGITQNGEIIISDKLDTVEKILLEL